MRQKRLLNWWEPVYNQDTPEFQQGEWPRSPSSLTNLTFRKKVDGSGRVRVKGSIFNCCDFEDDFTERTYLFEDCAFNICDFGGSRWKYSKFRSCNFHLTSFSVSTFLNCELRDCSFSKSGMSGNTTVITDTLITNPSSFLLSADIFPDQLPENVSEKYQNAHMIVTQSTLSRIIMDNLSREGSDESYYDAVKSRMLLSAKARYAPSLINLYGRRRSIKFSDLKVSDMLGFVRIGALKVGGFTESVILQGLGFMNAWGASISRSVLIGSLIMAFYASIYRFAYYQEWAYSLLKTSEIFLLFGYTNHTSGEGVTDFQRFLALSNAFIGLVWYAVFITTVITKLTRQRG